MDSGPYICMKHENHSLISSFPFCMNRWVVENRLDKLKFARQKLAYCYFSAAATLTSPEHYDARLSWAKNGVLTTVVDDFFDVGGSEEELVNLIQLVEKYFFFPFASNISRFLIFRSVSYSFLPWQHSL